MADDLFRVQELPKRTLRLRGRKRTEWIEDGFIRPDVEDDHVRFYGETDGYLGNVLTFKRFAAAFGVILIFCTAILSRAAQLQIVRGAEYADDADRNRLRTIHVRSDRGLIYDRYSLPLVRNVPETIVTILPKYLPADHEERRALLSELFAGYLREYRTDSLEEFLAQIETVYQDSLKSDKELIVASSLKRDMAILLQIWSSDKPAINVDQQAKREYLTEGPLFKDPNDTTVYPPVKSLSHILGYLSPLREGEYAELKDDGYLFNDVVGRTGLEFMYENTLRGEFGYQSQEVNAKGQQRQILSQKSPVDGTGIITTLDVEFQRAAESIIQEHLDKAGKTRAAAVILNPNNGEILSMVSLPTYDNNLFSGGISAQDYAALIEDPDRPLIHRAISGEYPSGSTFKPIVAGAALQEGIVSEHTSFLSTGGLRINLWFFPDWRAGGHGQTNIYHAIADSVNTYFYMIGGGYGEFEGLGVDRITEYARRFGLSQPLGIDLPGEKPGFLPSREWKEEAKGERWYIGDTYHLAIGQGDLLVTPLQMAAVYSALANGGTLYKPHLVRGYTDASGTMIGEETPVILSEAMFSQKAFDVMQAALARVVNRGTGRALDSLPIEVSGKTGTAQWHSQKDPHAWFAGYAPNENPQIAFVVLVEEGEDGSAITVSITRDILAWWIANRSNEIR